MEPMSAADEPVADPAHLDDPAGPVRAEILSQAGRLFCHYGFAKTNMADIARACEMSTANLYRYFKNKRAIGLAAVLEHFRGEEANASAAMQSAPNEPEARIRALARAIVSYTLAAMEENPKMIELAEFVVEDPEAWSLLEAHIHWRRTRIMEELVAGTAAGEFAVADPERTAIALQHAIKAFNMPFALARWRDKSTVMPELEGVLDLVFSGIRGPS